MCQHFRSSWEWGASHDQSETAEQIAALIFSEPSWEHSVKVKWFSFHLFGVFFFSSVQKHIQPSVCAIVLWCFGQSRNWMQGLWWQDLCDSSSESICACVCVCVYERALVSCSAVFAQSRCMEWFFCFIKSQLLKVGPFPKAPVFFFFFPTLLLTASFKQGNQYSFLFPYLLFFPSGQKSQHISITYGHHKSQSKLAVLHFLSPFTQIRLDEIWLWPLSGFQELIKQEIIG